jgi:hypothetical protein
MGDGVQEFTFKLFSRILIIFLFLLVGIPMIYAAVLNFQYQEFLIGSLTAVLFIAWTMIILKTFDFKLIIRENSLEKQGFFSTKSMEFADVDTIHFGSTWNSFHLQSNDRKIYVAKDYRNYDDLIQQVVNKVLEFNEPNQIEYKGYSEKIKYLTE